MSKVISIETIQILRERTGLGMMACKKALEQSNGDIESAVIFLRQSGTIVAEKRRTNKTSQGLIHSYIHSGGRLGVLLELQCETDFVANTKDMKDLASDLCMHVAAMKPSAIGKDDLPDSIVQREKEIYLEQLNNEKKPDSIKAAIVEGKLKKFYGEQCLLMQPFVKDESILVEERVQRTIAKVGENIRIGRFVRYEIGTIDPINS